MIHAAIASAARHYPLPVTFEGETLERQAFLDGAIHAEDWNGLAFGVYRDRGRGYLEPDLNFFGLTVPVQLPTVETVHRGIWSVRADVVDCPGLELQLPARREAVENAFLAEVREAARLAVYRAMAADPDPRPAFADWTRAREAGIELAPPPRVLRPWRPAIADIDDWREPPKPAPAGPDALVMACDPDPPEAQALWRAAERAGVAERLFEADKRLERLRLVRPARPCHGHRHPRHRGRRQVVAAPRLPPARADRRIRRPPGAASRRDPHGACDRNRRRPETHARPPHRSRLRGPRPGAGSATRCRWSPRTAPWNRAG